MNGNATLLGLVFMNKHAANDLVLQLFAGFGKGKWGSCLPVSCHLWWITGFEWNFKLELMCDIL